MIAIQALLILGFAVLLILLLSNPRNLKIQAGKKILGVLFVVAAVFFVVFPEISNDIAHFVGVNRGADLLLYLLTLSFIFVTLSFYLRINQEQNQTVKLARKIAILEAQQRAAKRKKKHHND
jgi:hypothetical protein